MSAHDISLQTTLILQSRVKVHLPSAGRTVLRALCANFPIVSFVWSVNERQFALRGIGKGIRRHDLCSKDIYRSKQMSFFSQRNNGGLPDSSLNLCEQKGLTKLELRVHVIQTLIKALLLILHYPDSVFPQLWALFTVTPASQRSKQSDGLLFLLAIVKTGESEVEIKVFLRLWNR